MYFELKLNLYFSLFEPHFVIGVGGTPESDLSISTFWMNKMRIRESVLIVFSHAQTMLMLCLFLLKLQSRFMLTT